MEGGVEDAGAHGKSVRSEHETGSGLTGTREVHRHVERAVDTAERVGVHVVGHARHVVGRDARAELCIRVIAHVQHATGETLRARNREVPREVETLALHAGGRELADDLVDRRLSSQQRFIGDVPAIADQPEATGRTEPVAVGVLQVAQADGDAVAFEEVDRGSDHQGARVRVGVPGVELGPVRHPLAGVRVEQHDRRVG